MGWRRTMRRILRSVLVGLVVAGCVRGVEGQAGSGAGDAVLQLHGTVVDGVSGKPVARALVESTDQRLATLTDIDGRFSIELHVPGGIAAPAASGGTVIFDSIGAVKSFAGMTTGLTLQAMKLGYLNETPGGTPVPLNSALSGTDFRLKLMPAAVIAGKVSASGVDAAANVSLGLYRRQVGINGRYQWGQMRAAVTNSRGEYRFAGLSPGEYTVETMEWDGETTLQRQHDAVIVVYPPMFIGGAKTLDEAAKLHAGYGSALRADLQIEATPFYPVTVPVAGPGTDGFYGRLIGEGEQNDYPMRYDERTRAVEGWLPDGHYTMLVSTGSEKQMTGLVTFSVAGKALKTRPVAVAPGAKIAIRVHDQRTKPEPVETTDAASGNRGGPLVARRGAIEEKPAPVIVSLNPGLLGRPSYTSQNMSLTNVDPGTYLVAAMAPRGYVAAMSSGGSDLLRDMLRVNASGGAEPIDVILRDDAATVSGKVAGGEAALPAMSTVFFLPTDASAQMQTCVAGPDGAFASQDLTPGSYRVFAVAGAPRMIAYRDEDAMHAFAGKGVSLQVTPNQTVQMEVPLLDIAVDSGSEVGDVLVD